MFYFEIYTMKHLIFFLSLLLQLFCYANSSSSYNLSEHYSVNCQENNATVYLLNVSDYGTTEVFLNQRVTDSKSISNEDLILIKKLVSNKDSYVKNSRKRCDFIPEFGLKLNVDGTYKTLLVSTICGVLDDVSAGKRYDLSLSANNSLRNFIINNFSNYEDIDFTIIERDAFDENQNIIDLSKTVNYWNQGKSINDKHFTSINEIWFSSLRPGTVSEHLFKIASELRGLDRDNVDALVLDDINRKIVYFEYIAELTKNGKTKSWFTSIKDVLPSLTRVSTLKTRAITAPSTGFIENSEQIRVYVTLEELRKQELECILQMRAKYNIELPVW